MTGTELLTKLLKSLPKEDNTYAALTAMSMEADVGRNTLVLEIKLHSKDAKDLAGVYITGMEK